MTPHQRTRGEDYAPLAVHLVGTPPQPLPAPAMAEALLSPQSEAVAVPVSSIDVAPPLPAAAPEPASTASAPATPRDARPQSASASSPSGTVSIGEPLAGMSALPPDLVARVHGNYMIEVEYPARLLSMPQVVYPPAALELQRGDSVVVWLAIDRKGAVEDTVFVAGLPGFIDAVSEALQSAKFLPAEERGEIIPFYIVLQFDFKAARAATATAGNVEAGK